MRLGCGFGISEADAAGNGRIASSHGRANAAPVPLSKVLLAIDVRVFDSLRSEYSVLPCGCRACFVLRFINQIPLICPRGMAGWSGRCVSMALWYLLLF